MVGFVIIFQCLSQLKFVYHFDCHLNLWFYLMMRMVASIHFVLSVAVLGFLFLFEDFWVFRAMLLWGVMLNSCLRKRSVLSRIDITWVSFNGYNGSCCGYLQLELFWDRAPLIFPCFLMCPAKFTFLKFLLSENQFSSVNSPLYTREIQGVWNSCFNCSFS